MAGTHVWRIRGGARAALPTRRSPKEPSVYCLDFHIQSLVLLRNVTQGISHVYVLQAAYTHVRTAL